MINKDMIQYNTIAILHCYYMKNPTDFISNLSISLMQFGISMRKVIVFYLCSLYISIDIVNKGTMQYNTIAILCCYNMRTPTDFMSNLSISLM